MSTQLTTKSAEANFLQLQQSCNEISEKCSKIEITDDLSLQLATQNYSMLKATIGQIEDIRVKEKAPYLDAGKQIDALAKKLSSPLEVVLDAGKKKVLAYNQEKLRLANLEQKRINDIKLAIQNFSKGAIQDINSCKTLDRLTQARQENIVDFVPPTEWLEFESDYRAMRIMLNDLCKAKRIELTAPEQADETMVETIKEAIVEKVEEVGAVESKAAEFSTTTKFRGTWKFEVVDESILPREFLMLNEKKVKEWLSAHKDALGNGEVQHGIKFFIEESVTIR